jgi:four helix bundle protein
MDNSYKKLDTYIKAKELVGKVYKFTNTFPDEEKYALSNQIRRAAISVPSNIAEGLSRSTIKEQCHFLDIAFGSLMEVDCQLEIACDLLYITKEEYKNIYIEIKTLAKMLIGLKSHRLSTK